MLVKKDKKANVALEYQKKFSYPCKRLQRNLKVLDDIKKSGKKVAVFGSAINSTFVGEYLGDSLEAFLDEDVRKVGKTHLNVKIMPPANYIGKVVMPYGGIIDRIKEKYSFPLIEVY